MAKTCLAQAECQGRGSGLEQSGQPSNAPASALGYWPGSSSGSMRCVWQSTARVGRGRGSSSRLPEMEPCCQVQTGNASLLKAMHRMCLLTESEAWRRKCVYFSTPGIPKVLPCSACGQMRWLLSCRLM